MLSVYDILIVCSLLSFEIQLICTLTPSSSSAEETHNTLKFAHRAKHIEIQAAQNKVRFCGFRNATVFLWLTWGVILWMLGGEVSWEIAMFVVVQVICLKWDVRIFKNQFSAFILFQKKMVFSLSVSALHLVVLVI